MRAGDVARDGEPQARAAFVLIARVIEPQERLEHVLAHVGRNARPVIVDRHGQITVIAVAGDTVEIRNKKIFINGKQVDDPHAHFAGYDPQAGAVGSGDDYGPKVVPQRHIFVMGDNRDRSYDSRFWGFVNLDDVRGKAFLIYWSWDGTDRWVRWERLGSIIY